MSSERQTQTETEEANDEQNNTTVAGVGDHVDIVDPFDDVAEVNRGSGVNAVVYFAGVNPREAIDGVELPTWWSRRLGDRNVQTSLRGAVQSLPRAAATKTAWQNPVTGDWERTEKHNAIYNPALVEDIERRAVIQAVAADRDLTYSDAEELVDDFTVEGAKAALLADTLEDDQAMDELLAPFKARAADRALWNIPSDGYSIINPTTFLDPLCDAVEDSDLGGLVFGEFELSRGGGSVKGDVYLDATQIDLSHIDGDRDPIMLGLEVGWDFFSGTSAYATGIAMDTSCKNSLRALTDRIAVKHTGDVSNRIDFWADMLEEIGAVADDLTQMIIDAVQERVDFRDLPFGVREFYVHLGFPGYLAKYASENASNLAEDPFAPTYWDLHSGATYALTHYARGNADRVEELNRLANDLLMNPAPAVEQVTENYRRDVEQREAGRDDEQTTLGQRMNNHQGIAQVNAWSDSVRGMKQQFEEREDALKARFKNARRDEDDE